MDVKILGSGCDKCDKLTKFTEEALANLGIEAEVEHITDFVTMASYGVMSSPSLVIDGKVVSTGKVLKVKEIEKILKKY